MNKLIPIANQPPRNWSNILREVVNKKGILAVNDQGKKRSYMVIAPATRTNESYHKLSIGEIANISRTYLEEISATNAENAEIKMLTRSVLKIKSESLNNTINKANGVIKEVNATWLNALKWVSIATLFFIPLGVVIHYIQKSTTDFQENIKKGASDVLADIDYMRRTFSLSQDEKLLLESDQIASLFLEEIDEFVSVFNSDKSELFKELDISNETWGKEFTQSVIDILKAKNNTPILIEQFAADAADRDTTIEIEGYKSLSGHEVRGRLINSNDFDMKRHGNTIVRNINKKLGSDDEIGKWSRIIQAVCQQGALYDISLLKHTPSYFTHWHDLNGIEHHLITDYVSHFKINPMRNDEGVIEKITISVDSPIKFYDVADIKADGKLIEEKKLKIGQPLFYHLSMDLTVDDEGQPRIDVLRREFSDK